MTYNVTNITRRGHEKRIGECAISLGKDGMFLLMDKDGQRATLELQRARVDWMQKGGLMVTGFCISGHDRQGLPKYQYRELFCGYREGGAQ